MKRAQYTALEDDFGFDWTFDEVKAFEVMWNEGFSVEFIAGTFGRDPDEVIILVVDRARKGKIKPRRGGVVG